MKYILLIYSDETIQASMSPAESQAYMGEYYAFGEKLKQQGVEFAGDALHSVSTSTTVKLIDGEKVTTDGPFAETKEQLGGYYIVDVESRERAEEIASWIPSARHGSIEVRELMVFD